MSKEQNYSSPMCIVVDVHSETVLCASVEQLSGATTETFETVEKFEW